MASRSDAPHLPRSAPIDAYGKGGFVFAGMSHRGSLLCLPDAIWAWPVTKPAEISEESLARVFEAANIIDTLILGSGTDVWIPPKDLRDALRAVHIVLDPMQTGPAIRTYNIMIGERRRVAAALIALRQVQTGHGREVIVVIAIVVARIARNRKKPLLDEGEQGSVVSNRVRNVVGLRERRNRQERHAYAHLIEAGAFLGILSRWIGRQIGTKLLGIDHGRVGCAQEILAAFGAAARLQT